jgi:hypothetical protein
MSSEPKPKKAKPDNYVRTFRHGAIAANIFRRQSSSGFEYLDFSLSRSWKTKQSGKEGYSANFFDKNAEDLHAAINDATAFIRAEMQELSEPAAAGEKPVPENGTTIAKQAA